MNPEYAFHKFAFVLLVSVLCGAFYFTNGGGKKRFAQFLSGSKPTHSVVSASYYRAGEEQE